MIVIDSIPLPPPQPSADTEIIPPYTSLPPNTLPDKPSELLALALLELEVCELSPNVQIDMSQWYAKDNGNCVVCLAGALMRNRLQPKEPGRISFFPIDYGPVNQRKLQVLDNFRHGDMEIALSNLNIDTIVPWTRKITPYNINPVQFKADMREMIVTLQSFNL